MYKSVEEFIENATKANTVSSEEISEVAAEFGVEDMAAAIAEILESHGVKVWYALETNSKLGGDDETEANEQAIGDSVHAYMHEIGRFRLLSREDEVELSKKASEGDVKARDAICNSNYRLVVSIAKRYASSNVDFMELVQEGNIGLMKAVEKFDYTKGFKFSTYASWWIRQSISRYIADAGRIIRLPVHIVESINRQNRAVKELTIDLGRTPSAEEVAVKTGVSVQKVLEIYEVMLDATSLDIVVGDDGDSCIGDFFCDDNADSPEENAIKTLMSNDIHKALELLDERERKVLLLRFGFDGERCMTLEEIGELLGVTRERVRQIEAHALRRLRISPKARMLLDAYRESA